MTRGIYTSVATISTLHIHRLISENAFTFTRLLSPSAASFMIRNMCLLLQWRFCAMRNVIMIASLTSAYRFQFQLHLAHPHLGSTAYNAFTGFDIICIGAYGCGCNCHHDFGNAHWIFVRRTSHLSGIGYFSFLSPQSWYG